MTKREREKFKKLVEKIYDGLPKDITCECFDADGNVSDEECEMHWALRKLNDVADGNITLRQVLWL